MPWIWEDSMWIRNKSNKPTILIFARNSEDKFQTKVFPVNGVEPYFYAPADASMFPSTIIKVADEPILDAFGRQVLKCTVNLPSDVPQVRKAFNWTCEADVLFDIRFLIDRKINYAFDIDDRNRIIPVTPESYVLPRLLRMDIEVRSPPDIMPDPENPVWPIVSFQCGDSYTKEKTLITVGVPLLRDNQIACDTEVELLEQMMDIIQQYDPDALTGWYTNQFDLPYIIKRAEALGVNLNRMTRNPTGKSQPKADTRGIEWFVKIPGRQCFDMYPAFKKWYKAIGELEAYDLKSISKQFGKFEYEDFGPHMDMLFNNKDWETFLQYIENDITSLEKIDEAIGLIDFYEGLRFIAGVKLEDTLKNSKIIESLLAHRGIKPMPTRNYSQSSSDFEGAVVLKPVIGVHPNVGVFDAAALYPTIIRGKNISPDIDGLIPIVITEILNEREKLRAIRMAGKADASTKNKETVLKFIANSFYGVLGWPQFRLFKPELAAEITRLGRDINRFLQEHAKAMGYTTAYGDTDSVFLEGILSVQDGFNLQASFNEALKTWAKKNKSTLNPTVKFEKYYRRIMFKKSSSARHKRDRFGNLMYDDNGNPIITSGARKQKHNARPDEFVAAKKRYAGLLVWKDGQDIHKVDYTGIEIKRSDQAKITKDTLKIFLDKILIDDDAHAACSAVRKAYTSIISGDVSLYDISIPRGVKDREADTAWARGIRNAESLTGGKFPNGVKPRLIYLKGADDAICIHEDMNPELIKSSCRIDWEAMAEKTITKKMKSFVESVGQSWDITIKGQKSLQDWF